MRQIEHKSVPDIRFPGFDKPWALQKVGDFVSEHREKSKQDNQHEVLTSSRAGLKPQSEYFGENRLTERDNTGFNVIPPNYITYRSRSDNREFFFNENNLGIHGIISVYYPVFRISGGNNQFFTELLNSKRHHVGRYSVGTSQTVLSLNDLRSIRLPIPCEDEQRKIAGFLGAVDERITQLTRKKALLEDYKKGCMQQLFSQSIRFKDDQGNDFPDWEEKRLGDILNYEQPTKYLVASSEYSDENETPVLTAGKTFILGHTDEKDGIFEDLPVIIFDDFTTAFKFVDFPFKAKSSAMKMLSLTNETDNLRFVHAAMLQIRFQVGEHKRYWIAEYQKEKIPYPHPDEQQKIADFLSTLDTKIDLVVQELEQAKTFKKGLLQQMFV